MGFTVRYTLCMRCLAVVVSALSLSFFGGASAFALTVAQSVPVRGEHVSYGDIIAYDAESRTFLLTQFEDDPRLFGVVSEVPPIIVVSEEKTVPIMWTGETLVNVTLENGPIQKGDAITSSSIPGKGQRAGRQHQNILGIAQEPLTTSDAAAVSLPDGRTILAGTIIVDIRRALAPAPAGGAAPFDPCVVAGVGCDSPPTAPPEESGSSLARYIAAGLIALGTLYFAFSGFISNINNGVLSVGRNPRAKRSIEAVVVLNGVLAVVIVATGLFTSIVVLFTPL